MLSAFVSLAAIFPAVLAAEVQLAPGTQWAFRGSVAKLNADRSPGEAAKTFDVTYFVAEADASGSKIYWLLEERGQGHWPWSERFGVLTLDAQGLPGGSVGPSLLYDYGAGKSMIALPLPLLAPDRTLSPDAAWEAGGLKYQVEREKKLEARDTWQVEVLNNFGRKRTVWIDKQSPLVVGVDERVFMNQGTEYLLRVRWAATESLDAEQASKNAAAFAALTDLRTRLNRPARSEIEEWNEQQLELLAERLPAIAKAGASGPLAKLLAAAAIDLGAQSGRVTAVEELAARFQGQPAPKFSLDGLNQAALSQADLPGNVTLLHFWDYRNEPLEEPYGQVGYLEFLFSRHKVEGLKVYGVAVDGRFDDEATRGAAASGVRKLKSFMNLSYPILFDGGKLVKQFGDPRLLGATLPLFVVIGPDGKILHYHVGFYEVDRQQGLKELDQAIGQALKNKKKS
ncbi:MAG TPA: TlpA disulfide reductase family protein [Pirellulales bacterium]|nr:TlpA disulfide reductase family protein [Pirellulales bacterium]